MRRKREEDSDLRKRWILITIKIVIALIVMTVVVRTVDFTDIHTAFKNPKNPHFIFLAVILVLPNLLIQWIRWHFLLRLAQPDVRPLESVSSLFGGIVVGFITPGRIGEMGRSLFLDQIDRLQALGLVFIDKLYSFMMIFIGGFWGLFFFLSSISSYAAFIVAPLCIVAVILSVGISLMLLHPRWLRSLLYNLTLILPYRDKMKRFISCLDLFKERQAKPFLILSFSLYCIFILQFCLYAFAFQGVPLNVALTATTSTFFAKTMIPISLADLGIREGAAVFFFHQYGVDKVTAFNSSILLFASNVLLPSLIGLSFLPRLRVFSPSSDRAE